MITWQDYEKADNKTKFVQNALGSYIGSKEQKKALMEAEYAAGRDTEIVNTVQVIYDMTGTAIADFTASNICISSNLYHRLISQRCAYSLGNGVSFTDKQAVMDADGKEKTIDKTKEALGDVFDNAVFRAAYWSRVNGESYTFMHRNISADKWEYDVFRKAEFLPLYDEMTGRLRGGIRFWSLDFKDIRRPIIAELYTEEGRQRYEPVPGETGLAALAPVGDVQPYIQIVNYTEADGEEVVGSVPLPSLPIVPLYSGESKTADLDNLKAKIDALDIALSGFANDMKDCAQIYWLVTGGMGMSEDDKTEIRDRLKLQHMAAIDGEHSGITPYTVEPPHEARNSFVELLTDRIYSDYGAMNPMKMSARQKTATEIEAAYQPMDEEADAFEYQLIEYIKQLLVIVGIDDVPQFKRNKISNVKEQIESLMLMAEVLDEQTILEKAPIVTVDEVPVILARKDAENLTEKRNMDELKAAMQEGSDENRENGTEDRPNA